MYNLIHKTALGVLSTKLSCSFNGFSINYNPHSSFVEVTDKNGFTFTLHKYDADDAKRMEYFFSVAAAIGEKFTSPEKLNILYGFTKKQKPELLKILRDYPFANIGLYNNIDVNDLRTVLTFIKNIGPRVKTAREIEIEENKKRALIESEALLIQYKGKERLLREILSRQEPGQPLNIETYEEAELIYEMAKTNVIRKPKQWDLPRLQEYGKQFFERTENMSPFTNEPICVFGIN